MKISDIEKELKALEELKQKKVSFLWIPVSLLLLVAGYYGYQINNNVNRIPVIEQNVKKNTESIQKIDSSLAKIKSISGLATREDVEGIKGYVDETFNESLETIKTSFKNYNDQNRAFLLEYIDQQKRDRAFIPDDSLKKNDQLLMSGGNETAYYTYQRGNIKQGSAMFKTR